MDDRGRDAARPSDIPGGGWWAILRRVGRSVVFGPIRGAAAGVAFYGVFALVPGTAVVVSLYGLAADPDTARRHVEMLGELVPAAVAGVLADQMQALAAASKLRLGAGLGGALALALWSARAGVAQLITGLNAAYKEPERRSFLRYQAVAAALTLAVALLGLLIFALVVLVPGAVEALPLGPGLKRGMALARWPALAGMMTVALAVIYRFAPCRRAPKWRWVSGGAVVATGLWLGGSAAFSAYVARFPSYNETYGTLGAAMLLLMWFYLTAFAILFGAELNAETEHQTGQDTTAGPERSAGSRGAAVADTVAGEERA